MSSISSFRSAPNQVLPKHQLPLNLSHILPRLSPRQPISRKSYRQRHHRYDCSTFPIIESRLLAHLEIVTADELVVDDPHFEQEGYSEYADEPAPDTGQSGRTTQWIEIRRRRGIGWARSTDSEGIREARFRRLGGVFG